MYKVISSAPAHHAAATVGLTGNCGIFDASALLYQPASRAAIAREQIARLATSLALARWTSSSVATTLPVPEEMPFRAGFYAREQDRFLAWIGRGGVWAVDMEAQADVDIDVDVESACADEPASDDNC